MDASDAAFQAGRCHGHGRVAVRQGWAAASLLLLGSGWAVAGLLLLAGCTSLQVELADGTKVYSRRFLNETSASLTSQDGTAFSYSSSPSDQLAHTNALLMQQMLRVVAPRSIADGATFCP